MSGLWAALVILAVHVTVSAWCAFLHQRKAQRAGLPGRWTGTFFFALVGGWLIVPEVWDTSWMDKYIEEDKL